MVIYIIIHMCRLERHVWYTSCAYKLQVSPHKYTLHRFGDYKKGYIFYMRMSKAYLGVYWLPLHLNQIKLPTFQVIKNVKERHLCMKALGKINYDWTTYHNHQCYAYHVSCTYHNYLHSVWGNKPMWYKCMFQYHMMPSMILSNMV